MEKMNAEKFGKDLKQGFKYPWGKPSRLWNALWAFFIIFGWFALIGYGKKIARTLIKGQTKELPEFGPFWTSFKEGVVVFVFWIPSVIAWFVIHSIPIIGRPAAYLVSTFLGPWLILNFFMNETFDSLWEIKNAYRAVTRNLAEYIFALLKTMVYSAVYFVLCFVLIGIPCFFFGSRFFMADFYRRHN